MCTGRGISAFTFVLGDMVTTFSRLAEPSAPLVRVVLTVLLAHGILIYGLSFAVQAPAKDAALEASVVIEALAPMLVAAPLAPTAAVRPIRNPARATAAKAIRRTDPAPPVVAAPTPVATMARQTRSAPWLQPPVTAPRP